MTQEPFRQFDGGRIFTRGSQLWALKRLKNRAESPVFDRAPSLNLGSVLAIESVQDQRERERGGTLSESEKSTQQLGTQR